MKHILLILFILAFLSSCQKSEPVISQNKNNRQLTKNISEADRVKMSLIIPALDALSFQLEKIGYDTEVLNKINKYLKENSVSEFLENNEIVKEIQKTLESGNNSSIKKKTNLQQQEVFETF